MLKTNVHAQIVTVLFDIEKLPIPGKARERLRQFRSAFPVRDAFRASRGNIVLVNWFKPLHEDAVVAYLEAVRGWPLTRIQEQFARMDVDTQVNQALIRNQEKVLGFYERFSARLQQTLS